MLPILACTGMAFFASPQPALLSFVEQANRDQVARRKALDDLDRRTAVLDAEVKQTLLRVAATRKRAAEYLERKLKQEALEKEAAARAKADERKP